MLLKILVSRHSAFYSPLIATLAGGFLDQEGLGATYGVLPPGRTSRDALRSGEAHIIQSAVSSNWKPLESGITDLPVHFAQINQRDGFFLIARDPGPFEWAHLEGKTLLADHAGQPLAMLRYAIHHNGVDWTRIQVIDAGNPADIEAAFREGGADYAHLQGPAPQQLEREGLGTLVTPVGASMPEVAFSSLTALPEFLRTPEAQAFTRAYRKARAWVASEATPDQIAAAEAPYFPGIHSQALAASIARYQAIGCWQGGIEITRVHYEQSLSVFEHSGGVARRHSYDSVVAIPPA